MSCPPGGHPEWAQALREAAPALRRDAACLEARARLWRILHAALFASLRAQAGRLAALASDDLEDLASTLAFELVTHAQAREWNPGAQSAHEVAAFIGGEAREALAELARRRSLACPPAAEVGRWNVAVRDRLPPPVAADDWTGVRGYHNALGDCVRELAPRAREAWFLSACLDRDRLEVAAILGTSPANVDRTLTRARNTLGECLAARGQSGDALRPGAFASLWSEWQERQSVAGELPAGVPRPARAGSRQHHLDDARCADLSLGLRGDWQRAEAVAHAGECPECEARLRAHAGAVARARADIAGGVVRAVPGGRSDWRSTTAAAAVAAVLVAVAVFRMPGSSTPPEWLTGSETVRTRAEGVLDDELVAGFDAYARHELPAAIAALKGAHASGAAETARRLHLAHALLASGDPNGARDWLECVDMEALPQPWRDEAERSLASAWRRTGHAQQADSLEGARRR